MIEQLELKYQIIKTDRDNGSVNILYDIKNWRLNGLLSLSVEIVIYDDLDKICSDYLPVALNSLFSHVEAVFPGEYYIEE